MESYNLTKKFAALGYDTNTDYLSTFNEFVLKLEEEHIKLYSFKRRERFKNSKPTEWVKSFKSYCNELHLDTPDDFFNRNQLSDKQKEYVLNKLLNVSINKKYDKLSQDNKNFKFAGKNDEPSSKLDDSYKYHVDKLNLVLEKLNLPLLNSNSKPSELKSALDLCLKFNNKDNSTSHTDNTSNQSSDNGTSNGFEIRENLDFASKDNFRSMYTDELCKLQSEILWLTKEFSKLPSS